MGELCGSRSARAAIHSSSLKAYADSTTREVDGRMRVTLRLAHVHGLKRLVAGLPGLVTVVAPAEARAAVAEWAAAGLAGYSDREGAVPDEPETTLDD